MRVNLRVPYEEKDLAKARGARWDAALKTWFLVDPEDLAPFAKWLPTRPAKPAKKPRQNESKPVFTHARAFNLPSCNCPTPPWEDCEHTAAMVPPEVTDFIRSIARES